ncbi:MAG: isocitrate lyase [Bdellovibrio sp.]
MAPHDVEAKILTPEAASFLITLHEKFDNLRKHLLIKRRTLAMEIAEGKKLHFLEKTKSIRTSDWKVAEPPHDLQNRMVEITGPAEAKFIINGLNSGAQVFMADFEDALSPTWQNVLNGQLNLYQAVRKNLIYETDNRKVYKLNDKTATLIVRPRGLHLEEFHFKIRGQPISAALFDLGLYLFHNAQELKTKGTGPYFYIAKIENHEEAAWWNDVFQFAEKQLQLAAGTIKATVLIETVTAAFEMDEIVYALKNYIVGLNAGRWDYLFNIIKKFSNNKEFIFSDRSMVTMDTPFMEAYCRLLVQTCHKRNIHAMGGMSAYIPTRIDPEFSKQAVKKVIEDKDREARLGFDGTWVAHPDLVPVAYTEFSKVLRKNPHQKNVMPTGTVTEEDLLDIPNIPVITEHGIRTNISVCLRYLDKWLSGIGAVAIDSLMEDVATAEISRSQLWQWMHHKVTMDDGTDFNYGKYKLLLKEELNHLEQENLPQLHSAVTLLNNLILSDRIPDFLTLDAYQILINVETKEKVSKLSKENQARRLDALWVTDKRWQNVNRNYSSEDVVKLRTSVQVKHTLAEVGANKLWEELNGPQYTNTFGAMTGAQAVQMVKAGLKTIYVSGWQVAADANLSGQTYPDQSLYPSNSVPALVKRINNSFMRADQISNQTGVNMKGDDWYAPIIADAEAGFGGPLHAFELMKSLIEAGAAAVHFEDQLASEKKCGHLGGKVLVSTCNFIRTLQAARLAADVLDVPTVIIARTDALTASLLTSDIDPVDQPFLTGTRTPEGYYVIKGGIENAITRALAYAPWADVLWFETSKPDLKEAEQFAREIHKKYPGKILAYNCSPSFNWKLHLTDGEIAEFQDRLGKLGYKFQFITLAGWHLINYYAFDLAHRYSNEGMLAYVNLQQEEFDAANKGYTAVKHQSEVGTGYFDEVLHVITEGKTSTGALRDSTEEQFQSSIQTEKVSTQITRH